jgi:hypothetical protein
MDVDGVAVIRGGCAVYPVPAITKTTGLITNPRRVLASRNRGNEQLCLMSAGLAPPVIYASGLHRTPLSARCAVFVMLTLRYKSSA